MTDLSSSPLSLRPRPSMGSAALRPVLVRLPRSGFYILVISYLAAGAFLFFGLRTPRLDVAYEILQKRESRDFNGYTEQELSVLRTVLVDYSTFSRALTGRSQVKFLEPKVNGWVRTADAHLVVRPEKGKPTQLKIESQGEPRNYPMTVVVSNGHAVKTLKLESGEAVPLEFGPNELLQTTILGFKTTPANQDPSAATWGLRVSAANAATRESP